jgi:hypothetical protein
MVPSIGQVIEYLSVEIASLLVVSLVFLISAIDFYYSHIRTKTSDIVVYPSENSSSSAENHVGEYSFSLYFIATNRGNIEGHIMNAQVEQIEFTSSDGPGRRVLSKSDLVGPYGNEPIVVLNEEYEEDGDVEYDKGPILVQANSTKEILIVPRVMGGENPAYDTEPYDRVNLDLSIQVSDIQKEYELKVNTGTIFTVGTFDSEEEGEK